MEVIDVPASETLTMVHIAGATVLSNEAGWNQTIYDWALFIERGQTRGVFVNGELIATTAALPYESRLGYISMVLVAPRYRNRGIATRLLGEAFDHLNARNYTAMLDATPAGAVVYRRLGFEDIFSLTRWEGKGSDRRGGVLRRARQQDTEQLIALDASAFGAARPFLIRDLLSRPGTSALVLDDGFVVRRKGVRADQIGPLVAANANGAQHLLSAALELGHGPVFLDVPDHHRSLAAALSVLGFSVQRPFTRMARGLVTRFGDSARLFVAAGPEFG